MGLGSWFQETVSRPVRRTAGLPVESDVPGAPEPLDVEKTAQAQANANRFNISGPFGGVRWTQNRDGTWTQYQTPSALQERALSDLGNLAPINSAQYRIQSQPMAAAAQQRAPTSFQTQGPSGAYGVSAPKAAQWSGSSAGRVPTPSLAMGGIPNAPQLGGVAQWRQPNMGAMPNAPRQPGAMPNAPQARGNMPQSPNPSALPQTPGAGNVAQFQSQAPSGDDAQRATFERAMQMFQPQFQKQQRTLDQQLANQGLPMGSEAFGERQTNLAEGQSKAMTDAALAAVLAGNDEAARRAQIEMAQYQNVLAGQGQQFGQDMGAYNAALAGQGQGFNQQLGAFDAQLRGRGQQFGEELGAFDAQLRGRGQQFGEQLGVFDAALRGRGQQFGEQLSGYQAALSGQGQAAQQQLAQFQAALSGQGQRFSQSLSAADTALRAQGQQFGQDVAGYQTGLQGQNQAFQQSLARANQMFGQDMSAAQFGRQGELDLYDRGNQANQQNFSNELTRLQAMFGMNSQAQAQNFGQDLQSREAQRALAGQLLGYMPGVQQVPIDVLGPTMANQQMQLAMNQSARQRNTDQTTAMWDAIGSMLGGKG